MLILLLRFLLLTLLFSSGTRKIARRPITGGPATIISLVSRRLHSHCTIFRQRVNARAEIRHTNPVFRLQNI